MPRVCVDCSRISDWSHFHDVFAEAFGFPEFYGRNMDAWIDCLTSLDRPEDGMTSVHCTPPDRLQLVLVQSELLPSGMLEVILECGSFVNERRVELGEPPVLEIVRTA